MSYQKIETRLLNNLIDIRNRTTSKDSYGGLTESWLVLYNGIKGNIQSAKNEQQTTELGEQVIRTHTATLFPDFEGKTLVLSEGQKLYDEKTGLLYRIIGVEQLLNGNGEIHHFSLDLEVLREDPKIRQKNKPLWK